jgi:hypothetical protein
MLYTLTGSTGHGKTAIALMLALSVATGALFHDREIAQGAVLFLAGENAENVRLQWYALCADRGVDPAALPVFWHDGAFHLGRAADQLAEGAAGIPNLRLVVADTLQAFFPGDDDNSNIQMLAAARQFRTLTRLPDRPTVLVPAHPIKNAREDNLLPRGGGAFLNEIDGNLTVSAKDGVATLSWQGKLRGPSFEPLQFELVRTEPHGLVDERGRQMPCTVARPLLIIRGEQLAKESDSREDRALQAIRGNPIISIRGLGDQLGVSKGVAERLLDRLHKLKWIKKHGRTWVLTAEGDAVLDG